VIDFAAFCVCLGFAFIGVVIGELGRLTFRWNDWLPASFGWAMGFATFVVFCNAAVLAATGGSASLAYSSTDLFFTCCGWLLYAAAWPLSVNALGVILRK
jgi:hypothetical protein